MNNVYEKMKQPPRWALRQIQAGRLKGKTDINPQWRYDIMTEVFGLCGEGWNYELVDFNTFPTANGEIAVFTKIHLFIKVNGEWSKPIVGVGGSMLVENEKNGLHSNDEALKMAVTDALSVAMKMIGVASDVYRGFWDGNKYKVEQETKTKSQQTLQDRVNSFKAYIDVATLEDLNSEKYKTKFNELLSNLTEEGQLELKNIHNNRMMKLAEV